MRAARVTRGAAIFRALRRWRRAFLLGLVLLSLGALWSIFVGMFSSPSQRMVLGGRRSEGADEAHGSSAATPHGAWIGEDALEQKIAFGEPREPRNAMSTVPVGPLGVIPAHVLGEEDAPDRRLSHVIVSVHSSDFLLPREGPLYGDTAERVWRWPAAEVQPCLEGPPSEAIYPSGELPHLLFVVAFPIGGIRSLRPQCLEARKPRNEIRVAFAAMVGSPRDRSSFGGIFFRLSLDGRPIVTSETLKHRARLEWEEVQIDDDLYRPDEVLDFDLYLQTARGQTQAGTARGTLRTFAEGFQVRDAETGNTVASVKAHVRVAEVFDEASVAVRDALLAEVERLVRASLGSALECFSGLSVRALKVPYQDDGHDIRSRIVFEALMLGGHWLYGETPVQYALLLEADVTAVQKFWLDVMSAEVVFSTDAFWVKGSIFVGDMDRFWWGETERLDAANRALSGQINGNAIWAFGSPSFRHFYSRVVRPWMMLNVGGEHLDAADEHPEGDCSRDSAWNYDYAIFYFMAVNFRDPVARSARSKLIVTERIANMWKTSYRLSDLAPAVCLVHGGSLLAEDEN